MRSVEDGVHSIYVTFFLSHILSRASSSNGAYGWHKEIKTLTMQPIFLHRSSRNLGNVIGRRELDKLSLQRKPLVPRLYCKIETKYRNEARKSECWWAPLPGTQIFLLWCTFNVGNLSSQQGFENYTDVGAKSTEDQLGIVVLTKLGLITNRNKQTRG